MYKINSSSQKILEKMLGKKYREIVDMDYDDEISYIQKKNNRKLVFSNKVDHTGKWDVEILYCPEDVLKQWIK